MADLRQTREPPFAVDGVIHRALRRAKVGLAAQDLELRYTWAPMGCMPLGGSDERALVGRGDDALYPADVAGALTEVKRGVLERRRGATAEIAVEFAAGRCHFDLTIEPLLGADGAVTGVTVVAVDVTARVRAQQEAEGSRARLAEAEHVARLGSWEWDIAANEVVWSEGLFEIYGIDPSVFEGRYRPASERVHPEDRERVDVAVRHALDTCEPIDLEYRIVRPDGRVRRVHGRAEVVVDDAGRPIRLAGTAQDVTEVRATAEALEQTAEELGRRASELHRLTRHEAVAGTDVARALTARQVEILSLVAEGLSNAEIGHRLYLSEGTIKWHVRKILRALGVANHAQAVARYLAAHEGMR